MPKRKTKSQKKDRLGYLGEHESKRLVKAFYEDQRLRRRTAVVCGVGLFALMVWGELAIFWCMTGR